jgi:AbrB family looped-hinge helix DNA binding protein
MRVKVSSKYQVVIPREIRETMHISPGEYFEVIPYENRLEFLPVRDIRTMRGFLKGIDTTVERDGDRM